MKITSKHYNIMKAAIAKIWTQEKHECQYQFIINEGKAKDINKRLRWDWLHYAKLNQFICDEIYLYANNDHIDTALKRIIKEFINNKIYSVWVGASEVNNNYLAYNAAQDLAAEYINDGYDNVVIRDEKLNYAKDRITS